MDIDYLKETVAEDLAKGLVNLLETRPADPISFLGEYLVALGNQKQRDRELKQEEKTQISTKSSNLITA